MRGLIWVTVILAALWGGWWLVGSRGVKAGAEAWFADQAARGMAAGYDDLAVQGFPNRFDLTVTAPRLADPATGFGWRAPFAQVFAMSWKPWHLIAALPGGQVFDHPGGTVTLDGNGMLGSLLLVPGPDLALSEAVVEGADLQLTGTVGVRAVGRLVASVRDEGGQSYRLGLSARDAVLDKGLAGDLGAALSNLHLDGRVTLSAPLDRHAGQTKPSLRGVQVQAASLDWGALRVTAKGALAPDSNGFAAGEIAVQIKGWQHLPPLLVRAGLIAPALAEPLARGFQVMAEQGNKPEVLVLALTAKDGQMSLGPLPLGPAPFWGP